MRISEVAKLTGLADSNIRFYEKKGLLAPQRETDSRYRDYSDKDVDCLKRIILYRKMNFSIETIRLLQEGKTDLAKELKKQEDELSGQVEMLQGAMGLCRKLQLETDLDDFDVDAYLNYVQQEEAGGKKFGRVEEFLDDLADFSRISVLGSDPYVGGLFQNVWVIRGISLLAAILMIGVPIMDIVGSVQRGEGMRWMYLLFWAVLWVCIFWPFLAYRKKEKD